MIIYICIYKPQNRIIQQGGLSFMSESVVQRKNLSMNSQRKGNRHTRKTQAGDAPQLSPLSSAALAGPWANICASRSSNEIRTCDSYGCGQYSAQRYEEAQTSSFPVVFVLFPRGHTMASL